MWDFRLEAPSVFEKPYRRLLKETSRANLNFNSFDYFQNRLRRGGFLVHKNHYQVSSVGLFRNEQPRIFSTFYRPVDSWGRAGLGVFATANDLQESEAVLFWQNVRKNISGDLQVIAPFNGHHYLGFSIPAGHSDAGKIGFMTSALNLSLRKIFTPLSNNIYRKYHSLESELTSVLVDQLEKDLAIQPPEFKIREFSQIHAQRDLAIMNQLVNACFTEHFDFMPLTDEENWDIMKWIVPLIQKGTFLFLMNGRKEIGFAFAMMDFNQILGPFSDIRNSVSLFTKKARVTRARIIHIGLHKDYRGQKLVKFLRHRLLLNLARLGAQTVESSYIDEGNQSSLGNVRSTGAKDLHTFQVFSVNN